MHLDKWHCDKSLANGVEVTHYNFIHEYMTVHKAITPEIVKKAFAKTGLVPLNPMIFNNNDFALSLATQAQALEIMSNEIEQFTLHLQVCLEYLMMEQLKSSRLASRTTLQIQPMPTLLRTLISQPFFMQKGKGVP